MRLTRNNASFILLIFAYIAFIYWVFTDFSWLILLYGFLYFHIVGRIGNDIGFHRYYCHRSFKAPDWFQYLMLFCGTIFGSGSSLNWVAFHNAHHANSDSLDPWRTNFRLYKERVKLDKSTRISLINALKDGKQVFFDKYYAPILSVYLLAVIEISITMESLSPLMVLWVIPRVIAFFQWGLIDIVGHRWGYQTYNSGTSRNNAVLNLLTIGQGMHNNHHANPRAYRQGGNKWYEFDLSAYLIANFIEKTSTKS